MEKLVFITGASSGIGQALALWFSRAGYHLALVARRACEVQFWAERHVISIDSYRIYSADVSDSDGIVAACPMWCWPMRASASAWT